MPKEKAILAEQDLNGDRYSIKKHFYAIKPLLVSFYRKDSAMLDPITLPEPLTMGQVHKRPYAAPLLTILPLVNTENNDGFNTDGGFETGS